MYSAFEYTHMETALFVVGLVKVRLITFYYSHTFILFQEGFCHCGESENCTVAHIKGFVRVPKNNSDALKYALVTHGPIASSVNSDRKSFRFYSHGIYDDPECGE